MMNGKTRWNCFRSSRSEFMSYPWFWNGWENSNYYANLESPKVLHLSQVELAVHKQTYCIWNAKSSTQNTKELSVHTNSTGSHLQTTMITYGKKHRTTSNIKETYAVHDLTQFYICSEQSRFIWVETKSTWYILAMRARTFYRVMA